MGAQSMVRDAFAVVQGLVGDLTCTIKYNGETATGIKNTRRNTAGTDGYAENGVMLSEVRVDASDLTRPENGKTILIDDVSVMVTNVYPDPVNGLMVIQYAITNPVTEGA